MASAAPGARLQKPSWKDPRLLIGILLVLVSVLGVLWLVNSMDRSVEVYAARNTIAVGQRISAEDLSRVRVSLGEAESHYLGAQEPISDDTVALSSIGSGQLIPRSSMGAARDLGARPIAVAVEGVLPEQLVQGARADLWVALPTEEGGFEQPKLLVRAAEISRVVENQQALGISSSRVVMVMVPEDTMAQILQAQNNKARISLVWNPRGEAR